MTALLLPLPTIRRQVAARVLCKLALVIVLASNLAPGLSHAEDGVWTFVTSYSAPTPRFGQSSAIDPVRARVVMFGGSPGLGSAMLSDLWAFSTTGDNRWGPLVATGTAPGARYTQSQVYDPVRDRMLFFGGDPGFGVPFYNDVWALALAGSTPSWSQVVPAGSVPDGRSGQTLIYDPVRDRLVLYGGQRRDGSILNDVWALSLAGTPTWSQLVPTGVVGARAFHSAIYDPVRDRMLVYGGFDGSSTESGSVYALDLGTLAWSQVTTAGSVVTARYSHAADYDSQHDAMLVFGGTHSGGYLNQALALSLAAGTPAWSVLSPSGLAVVPASNPTANFDSAHSRLLVFGGISRYTGATATVNFTTSLLTNIGYLWENASSQPTPRQGMASAYDASHRRLVAFGGYDGVAVSSETYAYDFASRAWSQIQPTNVSLPSRRWGGAAAYDGAHNRVVMVDGFIGDTNEYGSGYYLNDVWGFDLTSNSWSPIAITGAAPTARRGHSLIVDTAGNRLVLFGGYDLNGSFSNEVWTLSLSGGSVWTKLTPSGTPPSARNASGAIYDPVRQRLVVFGGSNCCANYGDTYALSLSGAPAWSLLAASGSGPAARTGMSAVYDNARDALLVFGGGALPVTFNDAWELPLGAASAWRRVTATGTPPATRAAHIAGYDPLGDRLVVADGSPNLFYAPYYGDTYELQLSLSPTAVRVAPAVVSATSGAVLLSWRVSRDPADPPTGSLWRRDSGEWTPLGSVALPLHGDATYRDTDIVPGHTYQYRLELTVDGVAQNSEIVSVAVPAATAAVEWRSRPRARAPLALSLNLPAAGSCAALVCDVHGRVCARGAWAQLSSGHSDVTLDAAASLRSGVYVLTVQAPGVLVRRKFVLSP